jgi:hypothetical protein
MPERLGNAPAPEPRKSQPEIHNTFQAIALPGLAVMRHRHMERA